MISKRTKPPVLALSTLTLLIASVGVSQAGTSFANDIGQSVSHGSAATEKLSSPLTWQELPKTKASNLIELADCHQHYNSILGGGSHLDSNQPCKPNTEASIFNSGANSFDV